jgi:muramoyltetrapeptide carboxypeptidase LdcA involved in peptidoglycan recycling
MFPGRYEAGKSHLATAFGLDVIEMPNARRDAQFLYANPAARADDLMRAFADKSIAAIIASIGGDDAIRLIPHIDLAVIRDNPKIFLGYSDPTVLHFGCLRAGVGSFHGPAIMSGFAENGGMSRLSERSFRQAAFEAPSNLRSLGVLSKSDRSVLLQQRGERARLTKRRCGPA